jgi:hypothetical protein
MAVRPVDTVAVMAALPGGLPSRLLRDLPRCCVRVHQLRSAQIEYPPESRNVAGTSGHDPKEGEIGRLKLKAASGKRAR